MKKLALFETAVLLFISMAVFNGLVEMNKNYDVVEFDEEGISCMKSTTFFYIDEIVGCWKNETK